MDLKTVTVLAVIPARGGSKGIPRKNLRLLSGKPLVAHAVECSLQARTVNRTVVSTEDPEIEAVALHYGAEVIRRPLELAGDTASSESAILHVLDVLGAREAYKPDLVVFLQCTSPLTLPEDIDATVRALLDKDADSALAVKPFHYFLWQEDATGNAVGINHDKTVRQRRQDREPQYQETGAVYVMRTDGFKEAKHRFFGRTVMYEMPSDRCLEIDDPVDFLTAEAIMTDRQRQQQLNILPDRIGAVVWDFDGIFTDNRVMVFEDGREAVLCNRSDGMGISRLRRLSIPMVVLSTEKNTVVRERCRKLEIECMTGLEDKAAELVSWLAERSLDPETVVYVANDVNDLGCLQAVGCGVAVSDAYPEVKAAAKIVLTNAGGRGAIREIADLIVSKCSPREV